MERDERIFNRSLSRRTIIMEEEMVLKMSVILMCQMEKYLNKLSYHVMKTQSRENLVP